MSNMTGVRLPIPMREGMKLEDRLRALIRAKGYAYSAEETHVVWYRRYVLHHGKRHLAEMGTAM